MFKSVVTGKMKNSTRHKIHTAYAYAECLGHIWHHIFLIDALAFQTYNMKNFAKIALWLILYILWICTYTYAYNQSMEIEI